MRIVQRCLILVSTLLILVFNQVVHANESLSIFAPSPVAVSIEVMQHETGNSASLDFLISQEQQELEQKINSAIKDQEYLDAAKSHGVKFIFAFVFSLLALIAFLIGLGYTIYVIVIAYKIKTSWGIICTFIPGATFVFVCFYPEQAMKPFVKSIIALGSCFFIMVFTTLYLGGKSSNMLLLEEESTITDDTYSFAGEAIAQAEKEASNTALKKGYIASCAKLMDQKRFKDAFQNCKTFADQGDPRALNNLGFLYFFGKGVPRDIEQGINHFRKAANQNNTQAQFALGQIYRKGIGVKQSDHLAFNYFKQAAKQNYGRAQYVLGLMYSNGTGTQKDLRKARYWLEKAKANGMQKASIALRHL